MKKIMLISAPLLVVFSLLINGCCSQPEEHLFQVMVSNESDLAFTDHLAEIDLGSGEISIPDSLFEKMVLSSDKIRPYQMVDDDGDGRPEKLMILVDLEPGEQKKITAVAGESASLFSPRTQAELSVKTGGEWKDRVYIGGAFENINYLRVPDEHRDHSLYIRYEGPGWESDKVGYRFYLDWRNAVDVFGKMTEEMVLQDVGQDGYESYHELGDWGMDVLKVGESLGLGSVGIWAGDKANRIAETDSIICRIAANGPLYSEIETDYYGWMAGSVKTDASSSLSITAGSRLTKHTINTSEELENLCTGIIKDKNARFLVPDAEKEGWTYIASYGKQSLANDNLGLAVLFRSGDQLEITEDAHSNVVVLKPYGKTLTYYFLAAWEKEPGGITGEEEFVRYLEETLKRLDNPPAVSLNP